MTNTYKVKFSIEAERGQFTEGDLSSDSDGLSDGLIMLRIIEDGQYHHVNVYEFHGDGEGGYSLDALLCIWKEFGLSIARAMRRKKLDNATRDALEKHLH